MAQNFITQPNNKYYFNFLIFFNFQREDYGLLGNAWTQSSLMDAYVIIPMGRGVGWIFHIRSFLRVGPMVFPCKYCRPSLQVISKYVPKIPWKFSDQSNQLIPGPSPPLIFHFLSSCWKEQFLTYQLAWLISQLVSKQILKTICGLERIFQGL